MCVSSCMSRNLHSPVDMDVLQAQAIRTMDHTLCFDFIMKLVLIESNIKAILQVT
jgi:hypothetical protein